MVLLMVREPFISKDGWNMSEFITVRPMVKENWRQKVISSEEHSSRNLSKYALDSFTGSGLLDWFGVTLSFQGIFPGGFIGIGHLFTFQVIRLLHYWLSLQKSDGDVGFLKRRFIGSFLPLVLSLGHHALYFIDPSGLLPGIRTQIAATFGFVTKFYEMTSGGSVSQFVQHLLIPLEFGTGSALLSLWAWLLRIRKIIRIQLLQYRNLFSDFNCSVSVQFLGYGGALFSKITPIFISQVCYVSFLCWDSL